MVGGSPIFMPQQMPYPGMQPAAGQGAPQRPRQGVPPQQQAGGYVPPRLTPPSRPAAPPARTAPADPAPPRLARGVRSSEPARGSPAIPTPEELGVAPAGDAAPKAAALDWSATRRQMTDLGVTRFQLEHLAGAARFTCWIGGNMVQADGATEAEAVGLCLDRARGHTANWR